MQNAQCLTLAAMRKFVAASGSLTFRGASRMEVYGLIERTLTAQDYGRLKKKDTGVVRRYLAKVSGRSLAQLTRLIRRYRQRGTVQPSKPRRHRFPRRYTAEDVALLAAVDAAHEGLSGPALRWILKREYNVYGHHEYQRLASISASHIYNLRLTATYRCHHVHHSKTRPRAVAIGERRRPNPRGRPLPAAPRGPAGAPGGRAPDRPAAPSRARGSGRLVAGRRDAASRAPRCCVAGGGSGGGHLKQCSSRHVPFPAGAGWLRRPRVAGNATALGGPSSGSCCRGC